jgi:hypothetical protein
MKIMSIFAIFLGIISSTFSMERNQEVATNEISLTLGGYFTSYKEKRSDFLRSEPFTFGYHSSRNNTTSTNPFHVGNVFCHKSNWGEIGLYPQGVSLDKINYSYGEFTDPKTGTACILSTLSYEYILENESHPAYLIIEKVSTNLDGRGYSQACLKYFIDEFVTKHTNIKYVFSDLRNPVCTKFFPKYGFQSGLPDELKNIKFTRPMRTPYFWQNSHL